MRALPQLPAGQPTRACSLSHISSYNLAPVLSSTPLPTCSFSPAPVRTETSTTSHARLRCSRLHSSTLNPGNAKAALVEELVKQSKPFTTTRITTKGRVIAIGDLHGDWRKTIESLRTANVIRINENMEVEWTGGDAVVVQLGDVMDRGDHEIAIVMLLRQLHEQAVNQGGAVYMLNGNHESLNICGDFRYVTPGAFVESALFAGLSEKDLKDWDLLARVRYAVYRPGGPMAMELSKNPTAMIINDTAFAHGGLLPLHVNYGLERLNQEVSAWMRAERTQDGGKALPPFLAMGDANSIMWNRSLSRERFPSPHERYHACRALQQVLLKVGAKRLIVGHTPQIAGANCECDGQVWRMDVGMSYGVLNRPVQVLEITKNPDTGGDEVSVLSDPNALPLLDEDGLPI